MFAISMMKASTTNYFPLPSSPIEVNHMMGTNYHPGMKMVQASLNAQRACNEAIIIVYGLTGEGKTSSLNHLFGSEIIPKSKKETSDTSSVTEFISVMNSPQWEVTNLEIGFIDLPGWGDNRGDRQDARNLAAIEQFTIGHRHLGTQMYKCYPNIILIVFNVMNERMEGPESSAAKMLRMLKELDIVDIKHPNVVVILTHAMSLPPLKFVEELSNIERRVKILTKTFLKVEANVVYLENNASGFMLKKDGDWTVLVDNTLQPKNVFDSMIDLMTRCGDEVGVEAVRLYFGERGSNPPIKRRIVESDSVSTASEEKWRAIVIKNVSKTSDTEVTRKIKLYQGKHPALSNDRFIPLIFELDKAGFTKVTDFEFLNIDHVEDRVEPYLLNELDKNVLMDVFGVESRTFPDLVNSVGRGYDRALHDFRASILKPMKDYFISNGVNVPTCMRAIPLEEFIVSCEYQKSESVEIQPNISMLHLESDKDESACQSKIKPASPWTAISPVTSDEKYLLTDIETYNFTFTITRTIMNIQFVIGKDLLKQVSEEFIQDVNHLSVNPESSDVNSMYKEFFIKYGQYFVLGCDSGGKVTGEFRLKTREEDLTRTKAIIEQCVTTQINTVQATTIKSGYQFDVELVNQILQAPLFWEGGIKPEFCENIRDINRAIWHGWISSLKQKPIILTDIAHNLRLIPINSFVSCISKPISEQLKKVISVLNPDMQFFDGELRMEDTINTSYTPGSIRRGRGESIKPDPTATPKTRESASQQADTGNYDYSKGGFPGCAKVMKRASNGKPTQVEINTIEIGDFVLCVDRGNVLYKKIIHMQMEEIKSVQYLLLSDHKYTVAIGYRRKVVQGSLTSSTIANDLKLGAEIFSVESGATKVASTRFRVKGYTCELGNYAPKVEDKANIIVNNIVCGEEEEAACFPGNATVVLRGGERVRMDELKIGDYVLSIHPTTYKPVYSKVYLWAHRDPHITATFLHITHPRGHLHISANHLILTGDNNTPVPAHQLRVGDSINLLYEQNNNNDNKKEKERGDSHTLISVHVLHIHTCTQLGYYTPFTNNGLIVVDNIATSVYCQFSTYSQSETSSTWLCHTLTRGLVQQFGMHRVGQCVLTPVRVGCKLGMGSVLSRQMDTHSHIHKYCQWFHGHF